MDLACRKWIFVPAFAGGAWRWSECGRLGFDMFTFLLTQFCNSLSSVPTLRTPLPLFDETKGRPFYFCVMHRCKETNPNLKTLLVCRSRSFCLLPLPMSPDAPILYLITNLQLPMSPGAPILCLITNLNSSPHRRPWWNAQNWYWKSRFRGLSVVAGRTPGQWSWMSY